MTVDPVWTAIYVTSKNKKIKISVFQVYFPTEDGSPSAWPMGQGPSTFMDIVLHVMDTTDSLSSLPFSHLMHKQFFQAQPTTSQV